MEDLEVGEYVRMIDSILTQPDYIESQTQLRVSGSNNIIVLFLWSKIMNNLNLDVVIMREFPVVALRLREKPP